MVVVNLKFHTKVLSLHLELEKSAMSSYHLYRKRNYKLPAVHANVCENMFCKPDHCLN